jgi:hypothetical protein
MLLNVVVAGLFGIVVIVIGSIKFVQSKVCAKAEHMHMQTQNAVVIILFTTKEVYTLMNKLVVIVN